MKLAISNIAWGEDKDDLVYSLMAKYNVQGLEIAPSRIFSSEPYKRIKEAAIWARRLKECYGLSVCSLQSIWRGRKEQLFGSTEERIALIDYTKASIDFAQAVGAHNLVFGCPNNRSLATGASEQAAIEFFRTIGEYAYEHGSAIGMEANPTIYGTNYVNTTKAALLLIEAVATRGFKLNLDIGALLYNKEGADILEGKLSYINHVHLSRPHLLPSTTREEIDLEVASILRGSNYLGYVSLEMAKVEDLPLIESSLAYLREVFG